MSLACLLDTDERCFLPRALSLSPLYPSVKLPEKSLSQAAGDNKLQMIRAVFAAMVMHIAGGEVMVERGELNQVQKTQQWHKNFARTFWCRSKCSKNVRQCLNYLPRLI